MRNKYQQLQQILDIVACDDCGGSGVIRDEAMDPSTFKLVSYYIPCYACNSTGISRFFGYKYDVNDLLRVVNDI